MDAHAKHCQDILLTDTFMEEIRNSKGTQYGLLPSYARFPECSGPGVAQINRIWAALPKAMRDSTDLRQRMLDHRNESTFWGGFSEAVVGHLLQDSGVDFEYSPTIENDQTPDFSAQVSGKRYLVEVAASSGDKGWDDYSEDHRLLKEELSYVDLPFTIYIAERLQNRQRNYHGIRDALTGYLRSLSEEDNIEDHDHTVEARGARLTFTIQRKDQEPFSFAGPGYSGGMPKPEKVQKRIAEKANKYRSNPLIVVYFCTTPIAEPARILFEALDGTPVLRAADGDGPGNIETWWESSGKGLWGANSPNMERHIHLHGVVAVTVSYSGDLMNFQAAKAIHPDHREGLVAFLPEVPDVFTSRSFDKTDPLVLVP